MKDVRVRVDDDLFAWTKTEFHHGFMQAFLVSCIENLKIILEEGRIPHPSEYSRRATLEAVAELVRLQSEKETDESTGS